jgi:hypothetical protein
MSSTLLTDLRENLAFKPAPPPYELALAHVRLDKLGFDRAVEERLLSFMRGEDEGLLLLTAPPGCGKSSLLEWASWQLAMQAGGLPVSCSVAGRGTVTPEAIVKAIADGLAIRLAPTLGKREREKLERALATTLTTQRTPTKLTAGITLPPLHGVSAQVAAEFASDMTTIVRAGGWRDGPAAGLTSLADLAHAHRLQLVVVIGDTDLWSASDDASARNAAHFFNAVRSLHSAPDAKLILAIQDHWATGDKTAIARNAANEFKVLAGVAARQLRVPAPASKTQALNLICAMIDRRVEISTDAIRPTGKRWCEELFSDEALALLGEHCRKGSPRTALAVIRDALDRQPHPPAQLDREDLLEAL